MTSAPPPEAPHDNATTYETTAMSPRPDIRAAYLAADAVRDPAERRFADLDSADLLPEARFHAPAVQDADGNAYARLPDEEAADGSDLCVALDGRLHVAVSRLPDASGRHATRIRERRGGVLFCVRGPDADDVPAALSGVRRVCTYAVRCVDSRGDLRAAFDVFGFPPSADTCNNIEPGALALRLRRRLDAAAVDRRATGRLRLYYDGRLRTDIQLRHAPAPGRAPAGPTRP